MRSKLVVSFFGAALSASMLIVGCGDDDKLAARGEEGDSCTKTADCGDGLHCVTNVCVREAGNGNGGGEGGDGNVVTPAEPSQEGESCTKRSDCADGLGCYNQICVETPQGEGGGGNVPGPRLGERGETCTVTSDCTAGLSCIPGSFATGTPDSTVGVCEQLNTGVEPSGKVCGGECKEAKDCCQLPVELHRPHVSVDETGAAYGTGAASCSDLRDRLAEVDCEDAELTPAQLAQCFALEAYCDCEDDTWACENSQCVYQADCSILDGEQTAQPGGCATYSRLGYPLYDACNPDTNKCAPNAGEPLCESDDDCEGLGVTDVAGDTCVADECTCLQNSACLRKCDNDLDCAVGKMCDTDLSVCVDVPDCTSDAQCLEETGVTTAKCVEGSCQLSCVTDYDCNSYQWGGVANALIIGQSYVCGPKNTCEPVGCQSDAECDYGEGQTLRTFCVDLPDAESTGYSSAITD